MRGRPSPILSAGAEVVSGPLLVFSLYLLFAGHNQPGGGFAGGLVAGVAVLLVWVAGGVDEVRHVLPVRATVLMGSGLLVASATGFAALAPGLDFLESGFVEFEVPLVGTIKFVSALLFDAGVYLAVVGMALGLVRALGQEADNVPEEVPS